MWCNCGLGCSSLPDRFRAQLKWVSTQRVWLHSRSQDCPGWLDLDLSVLCTTFLTAALAPVPHLKTAGQQWVLKHLQIFAFLRHPASRHSRGAREESVTFLKYVPADVLGNSVSHTAGILELQAQRTYKASLLFNLFSKSTFSGFFYSGLIVHITQTLAHIWCILTEEKSSMPKVSNANFFCRVNSQYCHTSFLWAWPFWMQMQWGFLFVYIHIYICIYTHYKEQFQSNLQILATTLHITDLGVGGKSGWCAKANKLLWTRTAVSSKTERE